MGYGNVRITLRLAQSQLSQMGITQPTNAELSAVLLGGDVGGTQVDGILAMRADGMGWGQIAQKYGTTVGQLMGNAPVKTTTATSVGAAEATTVSGSATRSASTPQARANGYIPSSPKTGHTPTRSNGYIASGKSSGAGMVSGAGERMAAAASDLNRGQTHKAGVSAPAGGAGGVSAAGQHASAGGGHAGGSNGSPGHARKN
jgi:LysM repeat protein